MSNYKFFLNSQKKYWLKAKEKINGSKPIPCVTLDVALRACEMAAMSFKKRIKAKIDEGTLSDGYHSFNELYDYRKAYNAAFFNELHGKYNVHKSKLHHDGEEPFGGGWFIVMADLPTGQISNHYELKDWDLFNVPIRKRAEEWDNHTPQQAYERLIKFIKTKQQKRAD